MHICDVFRRRETTFSFEFFPPRTPKAWTGLFDVVRQLEALGPDFVSVTYGAGGSTRQLTHDLVVRIKEQTRLQPIPHLTCVAHSEAEIREILERYWSHGIGNILALGGDAPRDLPGYAPERDAFRRAADLVRFIVRFNDEHAPAAGGARGKFGIGVAGFPEGHPATPNRLKEIEHLKAKVEEGADYVCTQLFFDNHDFFDFRERCVHAGIRVPIVAGIMPIVSRANFERIPEMALGARYPAALLKQLKRCESDEEIARVGVDWTTWQCEELLAFGVRGIHFYTLNRSLATLEIFRRLGVSSRAAQEPA
jgi:methylenetetrahydrofolate reductase (NADPH)